MTTKTEYEERADAFLARHGMTFVAGEGDGRCPPWCSDFGESTNSVRARDTYRRVVAQWKRVEAFFTREELEEMQEIQ